MAAVERADSFMISSSRPAFILPETHPDIKYAVTKSTVAELLRKSRIVVIVSGFESIGVVMPALCYIFDRASVVVGMK